MILAWTLRTIHAVTQRHRNILTLFLVLALALFSACGTPVKQAYRAPNLSDISGSDLIEFQDDLDAETTEYRGQFEAGQFQGYRYAANEGARVRVTLERLSGSGDPVLLLYGPQRANGVWGTVVEVADDTARSLDSSMDVGPLESGTYLFVVTTRDYPTTGRYRIHLECLENCSDAPECPLTDLCEETVCYTGFVTDANGCSTCECDDECDEDEECGPEEACLRGVCELFCHCSDEYEPVCGENGTTYRNQCEAGCEGVGIASRGECRQDCVPVECNLECESGFVRDDEGCETCECLDRCSACDSVQSPVCTRNGLTYTNQCQAECRGEEISYAGECREECQRIACDLSCENGYARDADGCSLCECLAEVCTDDHEQVCGANAVTYSSECEAEAAGVDVVWDGPCPPTCHSGSDCPDGFICLSGIRGLPDCDVSADDCIALCIERPTRCDPEIDSLTGQCAPDQECSREGVCESRCDCAPIYYPVCSDGVTYDSACRARCVGVTSAESGTCCDENIEDSCDLRCESGLATDPGTGCTICECAVNIVTVDCACDPDLINPVCGDDGNWYCNECLARCDGARVTDSEEECRSEDLRALCDG